ncbi:MAG: DUF58 domain-containing protein [Gemmatimonadales bacterium]|nr:DUF58 domain-containing protein [Gemmatimonadales bacterium]MYG18088.1 DUF58 domain-containing protein [Gemmatimonadales bacterium]
MIPREILRKVRRIEITTRGLVDQVFSGEYHSVFKGRGINFAEVREYDYGDDIRTIDWNVTARTGTPHVKIFEEERELTVMLLVDVSASGDFGTRERMKGDLAVEVCSLLAFSAIKNNDKVGLIIFSDRVEKFVPPRKGRRHVLRVLREMLYHEPAGRTTDLGAALEYLSRIIRRRAVVFVVSDFVSKPFEKALGVAGRRHDVVALRVRDRRESELPPIGLVELEDAETGERLIVDTSNRDFRAAFASRGEEARAAQDRTFRRSKVDVVDLGPGRPYLRPLMRFFEERGRRI